jgi:hypothetical protein
MDANEPFLPPREATANPPAADAPQKKRASTRKTFFVWLLLILMFVGVYQLFSGPQPRHVSDANDLCPKPSAWSSLSVSWGAPIGLAMLFYYFLLRAMRGNNQYAERCEPAQLAFADGDFARAAEEYRGLVKHYKGKVSTESLSSISLGQALVHQGALREAAEAFITGERGAGLLYGAEARLIAAVELARLYALEGRLDVARKWSEDARKKLSRTGYRLVRASSLRIVDALIAARAGEPERAATLLDGEWHRFEQWLPTAQMREAWLLRAFVSDGGQRGQAETWLRLLRSGRRGQLDFMGVQWPELQAFLAANDLAATAAPTS